MQQQTTVNFLSRGMTDNIEFGNTAVRTAVSDFTPDRYMREAYEQLIRMQCADLSKWQEIHRMKPEAAPGILMMALIRQRTDKAWAYAAQLIVELTMSPAHLFTECGDGIDYDEASQTAVFASQASVSRFAARFPEWVTAVQGATNDE